MEAPLVADSQTEEGGWGYMPGDPVHETAVTACVLQALVAARRAGVAVDLRVLEKAAEYLRGSMCPAGSFRYRLGYEERRSIFSLAAAATGALFGMTGRGDRQIERCLEAVMTAIASPDRYFLFGQFHAALAMGQAGDALDPEDSVAWYAGVSSQLLKEVEGGCWRDPRGDEIATSMAIIVLLAPEARLSIFGR